MSKTRNERKRERVKTAVMTVALVILWVIACTIMVKAFNEEAPVGGVEYLEQIGAEARG